MNDATLKQDGLSLSALRRIDDRSARFEAAWNAGEEPKIEDYLDGIAEPERSALFRELFLSELEMRVQRDEPLEEAVYLERFPLYSGLIRSAFAAPAEGDTTDDLGFLQPSSRPDSLGRLGHYDVLEVLGKGGFGLVLRAFDNDLQRVVAIKVLFPQLATTSPPRKRFLREARTAAGVHHDNVVQIYAVQEQPTPYLVMEYLNGETLQQRLDRTGPLEVQDVLRIGHHIAKGLAAAHGQGLIHRDIKPANIMLGADVDPHVKLTDFGLARSADDASLTQSGVIAGTPMYMAPEQALGQVLDQRADLFSFGSLLYVMSTGRPPFRASSVMAVLKRVVEDTPRPIQELIPETPAWLIDLIGKLLAKKPEERYQSAKEVADLLGRYQTELQVEGHIRDSGKVVQSATAPPRWRKPLALAAALLVVVVGAIVGFLHFKGNANLTVKEPPLVVAQPPSSPRLATIPNIPGWPNRALLVPGSQTALLTTSLQGGVVWDLASHKPVQRFDRHGRFVHVWGLAVSADGKQALTGDANGKIYLWNVATAQTVREFANPTPGVGIIAFAPGGQRFVTLDDGGDVRSWDVVTGESKVALTVANKQGNEHFAIAFSRAADRILIGDLAGTLKLADLDTGKELRRWKGHEQRVTTVAFSWDGRTLLSGDTEGTIRLWDVQTEKETAVLTGHTGAVASSAFTPDGRRIVTGGFDRTVRVWRVKDRREIDCFKDHAKPVTQVDVATDGKSVLAMNPEAVDLVIVWRLPHVPGRE